jgi:hypothetical protein
MVKDNSQEEQVQGQYESFDQPQGNAAISLDKVPDGTTTTVTTGGGVGDTFRKYAQDVSVFFECN